MSNNSPFILPAEDYRRDIKIVRDAIQDHIEHLKIMTGISHEEAEAFVRHQLSPEGDFPFHDPEVIYLERDIETGDRTTFNTSMSQFLKHMLGNDQIFAPTLTSYHHPKFRASPLAEFQAANVKDRGIAKKAMFKAEQDEGKSSFNYRFYSGYQTTKKLANNAVSGAMVNEYNPLFNKTGHSSLTSSCRQTSAYGNANNERFLAGNRHYWSYDIARNNIISVINHTDYVAFAAVMEKYQLHYPTVEETCDVLDYSAKLYFRSIKAINKLHDLISRLSPVQRAAFVYTGDMYHLRKFNDAFARKFMGAIIEQTQTVDPDPSAVEKHWPEDFFNLAKQLQPDISRGKSVDKLRGDPDSYGRVAAQTASIGTAIWGYSDLIKAFWVTDNLPPSIAMFPHSLRRTVLMSDTDSTIFTTQDWIRWYCNGFPFDYTHDAVCATMITLASQSIIHILAKMSANVGIETKNIFQISMKNEYRFDVFVPTQLGKHYYAQIGCQEGNVLPEFKKEIKGVHLKSSNAPKEIADLNEKMMLEIISDVRTTGKVSAMKYTKRVADLERGIVDSVKKGEFRYLKLSSIRNAEAYKNKEEASNYKKYLMWNETFGLKYGAAPPPPYKVIQVSMDIDTGAKTKEWLETMEDRELAGFIEKYLEKDGKNSIPSMMLPLPIISGNGGIPKEIMDAIDTRNIVHKASSMFYLALEPLGMYFNHTKLKQLAMDYY